MWTNPVSGGLRAATAAMLGAAVTLATLVPQAVAQEHGSVLRINAADSYPVTRKVTVGLDKSMVLELPREVGNVHISNPAKMDAVLQTDRRIYLVGVEVGQANAFFFDRHGEPLLTLEVVIERDLRAVGDMLHRLMPDADFTLEAVNDNIVLTGRVRTAADASRAADIVGRLSEAQAPAGRSNVVNMLAVDSREQVLLKVTVAEMNRTVMKQLGVNWDGNFAIGSGVLGFGSNPGFAIGSALANIIQPDSNPTSETFNPNFRTTTGGNGVAGVFRGSQGAAVANVRALENNGLMRTLAEPNLTAISGETAEFLAGGEFPVITGVSVEDGIRTPRVEFKPFGVGLSFTPLVLSEGRISLKLSTEVSELSNEGAVAISGQFVPGLKVRRATSTIELPSGGSLVMAGLLSDETRQAVEGLPGLKTVPILGALFRSRDYEKRETELVVIVTPYVVDPTARRKLATPDEGFAPARDGEAYLFGHLNRVYGRAPKHLPPGGYKADVGFIIE